ncbi:hypothetical protein SPBR_02317 [Sporothrix brasiliensis 5110]|uniref:Uncharacterized protein n=1 Tax=Sporothrix brasiliensis 5110 TaxID=1398154 RepID=A0A0C2F223_9PEZI|nr:uncharacterized protein SPBR_02317 [Sporothrix brasiliensis 5110]KIH92984.1 hypothetical protein SPBR_02317 [Sporothrix brasiliensis 5110]
MDHFNATVQKDGALVSTRRGLQVTKHKYHGISFVNTSGPAQPSGSSVGASGKKKGSKHKAAGSTSTFSAFSTPAANPAPPASSGFSTFSTFSPPAATPSGTDKHSAITRDKDASSSAATSATTTTSTAKAPQKSALNGGADPANPSKPLVHRWKLVTKPAAQKAKRESNAAAASSGQKQRPRPAVNTDTAPASSDRHPSPALSDTASLFMSTSTPGESATSFPSPFASPFLTSPGSVAESTVSGNSGLESLSPLSNPTSMFDGMGLFAPDDWEAEYISPSAAALRTSYQQNRAAGAAAKRRKGSSTSYAESKARKARITALANSYQQVARSLPTWTMCHVPQLNKFEQRLFHQFFQLIPRKLYPFEDLLQYNPTRSSEFYWMVVQDRAAVRCVLLCGAMLRAVLGGANTSDELALEVSNVCRIVNQQLALHQKEHDKHAETANSTGGDSDDDDNNADRMQLAAPFRSSPSPSPSPPASPSSASSHRRRRRHHVIPEMTLECITTLALMGGSTGRYDHWHLHMQALSKMVELNGGRRFINEVRPALLFKMRKTDLKGAMSLAIRPYLPFDTRRFPNISDTVLLDVTRQDIRASASALFANPASPCGVAPVVSQTLAALCVFVQAVQLVRDLARSTAPLPLDPYCFSEELYWLQHHLVSQPGPLRQDVTPQDAAAAHGAATAAIQAQPTLTASSPTLSSFPSPSISTASAPSQAPRPNTLLPVDTSRLQTESYVRNHRVPLAALYIIPAPAATPSSPTSTCLEPAMRIGGILYLKEFFPDFPRNLGGYAILLHLLRWHLGEGDVFDVSLLTNRSARALLLWICLVGDTVSRLANNNEERRNPVEQYDRRVFRDRLADLVRTSPVVEGTSPSAVAMTDVDALSTLNLSAMDGVDRLPESDWALCRLLDLGKIEQLGEWNDRQAVLNILLEGGVFDL